MTKCKTCGRVIAWKRTQIDGWRMFEPRSRTMADGSVEVLTVGGRTVAAEYPHDCGFRGAVADARKPVERWVKVEADPADVAREFAREPNGVKLSDLDSSANRVVSKGRK